MSGSLAGWLAEAKRRAERHMQLPCMHAQQQQQYTHTRRARHINDTLPDLQLKGARLKLCSVQHFFAYVCQGMLMQFTGRNMYLKTFLLFIRGLKSKLIKYAKVLFSLLFLLCYF